MTNKPTQKLKEKKVKTANLRALMTAVRRQAIIEAIEALWFKISDFDGHVWKGEYDMGYKKALHDLWAKIANLKRKEGIE